MKYDVIVIGGGPSGLMAAIAAGEKDKRVLLIDKGNKLGRKLAISGGGRCNVTNRHPVAQLIEHIPGNGRFLYSAFSIFNNEDIIRFFEQLGVELKEEDNGRMFPVSDDAQSVVQSLLQKLTDLHVDVWTNSPVKEIIFSQNDRHTVVLHDGRTVDGRAVVIAVGGKSAPHTGSTGDGYAWAQRAGHTITHLFPTEVPLTSKEAFVQERKLQGLSLQGISLSVLNKRGKPIVTHEMDMIFTHFGVSGPAVLRCSQFVVKQLWKQKQEASVTLQLDSLPEIKEEVLFRQLRAQIAAEPSKSIKNSLRGLLPERYLLFLLEENKINPAIQGANLPHDQLRAFVKSCKQFHFKVNGTLPFERAFVTGGGVSVKEIEPQTMASRQMNNLYFCGEILDVHGYTGGYNITAALVTGRIAGLHAARHVDET